MKNLWTLLFLLAALILVLVLLPGPVDDPTPSTVTGSTDDTGVTAITNVRLFDGERIIERATVVLSDGRVAAAGPAVSVIVPDGARRIDGDGRTALPGLIDAHVHAFGAARADAARFGVTTLLDMFRPPEDFPVLHRERAARDAGTGADLYSAGYLATAEGGHGTQYGIDVPLPAGPDDAQAWVDARLAEGSDWIKIVVEDGGGWGGELPSLDAATVAALVEAAHARGAIAVAHVGRRAEADLAVAAGVDGLVHLFADEPLDAETAREWAERGLFVIPTTPVLAAAHGQPGPSRYASFEGLETLLSTEQRRSLSGSFPNASARADRWANVAVSIRALHAAGVPLLAGSDAPNPGTAQGISLLDAVIRLGESGLSPIEALQAATSVPARTFPMLDEHDHRGCLQPGCRGDLLLVEGNPFETATDLLRIDGVWKNGAAVDRTTGEPPATLAPSVAAAPQDLLATPSRWMPAADDYMGGSSEASIRTTDEGLAVSGILRPGFAFPYAGVMWNAADIPMQPIDGRGWSSLTLQVRGEADALRVMFFAGDQGAQPVWRDLPVGTIELELGELLGPDQASLRAIGVFASSPVGPFDFVIEEARLQ